MNILTEFLFLAAYLIFPDNSNIFSQYAPYVAQNGNGYTMLSCRNSYEGHYADRLWRADSDDGYVWSEPTMVLAGGVSETDPDFLTCAGAFYIGEDGWHLYYLASTATGDSLALRYATSADGWTWEKHGVVYSGGWIDSPSIVREENSYYLYLNRNRKLVRFQLDGEVLSSPVDCVASTAVHSTVTRYNDKYYYVYAYAAGMEPPIAVAGAVSDDPLVFTGYSPILGPELNYSHVWTPYGLFINGKYVLYFASNTTWSLWWGQDSIIRARVYDVGETWYSHQYYVPYIVN